MRYYLLFDRNVVQVEAPVTVSTFDSSNFEKKRKRDEEDYDVDEVKESIAHRKSSVFG